MTGASAEARRRPAHKRWPIRSVGLIILLMVVVPADPAGAHVKWFSEFDFADRPRSLPEVVTGGFVAMTLVAMVVVSVGVVLDQRLDGSGWYRRINDWLQSQEEYATTVIRLAMAAVLLVSWEGEALLTPELAEEASWIGWYQLLLVGLLVFGRTARIGGAGIVALWVMAVGYHGIFHMLDYLHYIGIGIYLYLSDEHEKRLADLGLPVLYATVGFALIWAGFEKLVYPQWGMLLLDENPQLALGLSPEQFLQGAAFTEITLGFLLIIGLLERPLASVITMVFISTTLVFGRVELVGHTPLHAALVVFLISGPATAYPAPIDIDHRTDRRMAFAAMSFGVILAVFSLAYIGSARAQFDDVRTADTRAGREVQSGSSPPPGTAKVLIDPGGPGDQ